MSPRHVVTPAGKRWQVPRSLAGARGTFVGRIRAGRIFWRLSYRGLRRQHSVLADVHTGKPGRFGPLLFRLCGPCKARQHGSTRLKRGYGLELRTGSHWITLITDKYPNGVLRGQLKVR